MAITQRIGLEPDFRPAKMQPGELAISTDTGKAWYCWSANKVKVFATEEDLQEILNSSGSEYEKFQELIKYLKQNPNVYDQIIKNIASLQETKQDKMIGISTSPTHTLPTSEGAAVLRELPGVTEQVVTTGAQLFDASRIPTKTANGVTVTNNGDGSFTVSGTSSTTLSMGSYTLTREESVRLFPAGTYTLKNQQATNPYCYFSAYANGSSREMNNTNGTIKTLEITPEMVNAADYRITMGFYMHTAGGIAGTIRPMLYRDGDGTWEPYTGGKPAPNPDYPQRIQGVGDSGWFDGELQQGGYHSANGAFNAYTSNVSNSNKIKCSAGENIELIYETSADFLLILFYKDDDTFIKSFVEPNVKRLSAIVPDGAAYMRFDIQQNNGIRPQDAKHITVLKNGKYAVQVKSRGPQIFNGDSEYARGKVQTEYQPYKESTAYIEIDQPLYTGDKIYLEDGHLWEYRENAVVEYDGSADEKWEAYRSLEQNEGLSFCVNITEKQNGIYTSLCTYFRNTAPDYEWEPKFKDKFGIYSDHPETGYIYFRRPSEEVNTIALWRTWLASHPITVVYKLATPTKTRLNQPAAYGLRTYGEQTHIYIPDALEPEFSVDYPLNPAGGYALDGFCQSRINEAQEEINRQALDDRIAKIEIDLGANTFIVE